MPFIEKAITHPLLIIINPNNFSINYHSFHTKNNINKMIIKIQFIFTFKKKNTKIVIIFSSFYFTFKIKTFKFKLKNQSNTNLTFSSFLSIALLFNQVI